MGTDEEETQQQREAFLKHLDDASSVVATWEPWERNIFGDMSPTANQAHADTNNGIGCYEGEEKE